MTRPLSPVRAAWEASLRVLMRNDWPARLAVAAGAPTGVQIVRHEVRARAPLGTVGGARPLTIAFASDLHAGPTTPDETLDRAFEALAAAGADLIVLGGDFVGIRAGDARRIARRLASAAAPLGVFAVLGNHDHYVDAGAVRRELEPAGVRFLVNEAHPLPAPFDGVTLVGLDDHVAGAPDGARAFAGARDVRVLAMHEPSGLVDAGEHAFAVALCGHTHGGQIALPGPVPLFTGHGPLSRRFCAGRYDLAGGRTLLTSRGVGCSILPFRWNAPADVLVCTLTSY